MLCCGVVEWCALRVVSRGVTCSGIAWCWWSCGVVLLSGVPQGFYLVVLLAVVWLGVGCRVERCY